MVIGLCTVMIVGGGRRPAPVFSIALVADWTAHVDHATRWSLLTLAYRHARHDADDTRFSFGTGKLGELAGLTSDFLANIRRSCPWRFSPSRHGSASISVATSTRSNSLSTTLLANAAHRDNNMRAAIVT
jgi:hypothetical protein